MNARLAGFLVDRIFGLLLPDVLTNQRSAEAVKTLDGCFSLSSERYCSPRGNRMNEGEIEELPVRSGQRTKRPVRESDSNPRRVTVSENGEVEPGTRPA
jgi:hypothetical protein